MHVVNSTMKLHRSTLLLLRLDRGPKGPPSAPPAIPPIIINPFSRKAPREPNIDPVRVPPPPPIRRPGLPSMRM
jgi:hypothetical protein